MPLRKKEEGSNSEVLQRQLLYSLPADMAEKAYQIVVLGATGFVGKLVMLHIAETPQYAVCADMASIYNRCLASFSLPGCAWRLSRIACDTNVL